MGPFMRQVAGASGGRLCMLYKVAVLLVRGLTASVVDILAVQSAIGQACLWGDRRRIVLPTSPSFPFPFSCPPLPCLWPPQLYHHSTASGSWRSQGSQSLAPARAFKKRQAGDTVSVRARHDRPPGFLAL